ncbi:hypothetical protein ACSIGC_13945 [Tenacibaculum sp. ZS6-P6]|uniref:hypothetical protein n=1 Tax=Tenacibaculum sp. ZS6-P6 TaxID=3447503 RepID=UPI003F9AF5B2
MKKVSIAILFLLLGLVVKAQEDITLFRFLSKKQENGKIYVLTPEIKNGHLLAKEITNEDFNLKTGYLDAFIVMPHPNLKKGEVLIVSARDKKSFLKLDYSASKLELGNYFTDTHRAKDYFYRWHLNYAGGNNEVYFQGPLDNTTSGALTFDNGVFKLQRIEDTKGIKTPTDGSGVPKGERIADKQVIIIQKLKNSI